MTNLETSLVCVIAFILLAGGFGFYFEHRGAAACKQADTVAVTKQEVRNEAKAASDANTINTEAKTYVQALAAVPDPTPVLVCVRQYTAPRPLSETATARPGNDGPNVLPVADRQGFDPGPKLAPIGREADARVAYLQDYITRVCLAP